jgi:hypothetical protein
MNIIESITCPDLLGFQITLDALVEDTPLADTFDPDIDDVAELARRIDAGDLLYFCARVSAYKQGILLAQDYLGGCLYDSLKQFEQSSNYFADMVDNVIAEAQDNIRKLADLGEIVA